MIAGTAEELDEGGAVWRECSVGVEEQAGLLAERGHAR